MVMAAMESWVSRQDKAAILRVGSMFFWSINSACGSSGLVARAPFS